MPINAIDVHSVYGEITLPDTTPAVVPLTFDGATVTQIDIPEGSFFISDVHIGLGFIHWAIEVDNGSGFTPIAIFGFVLGAPVHTEIKKFNSAIVVKGGHSVAMRIVATAQAGVTSGNITLRAYTVGD